MSNRHKVRVDCALTCCTAIMHSLNFKLLQLVIAQGYGTHTSDRAGTCTDDVVTQVLMADTAGDATA